MVDPFARLRHMGVVYADHAATTQLPDSLVIRAQRLLAEPRANAWRGLSDWAERETTLLEEARSRIAAVAGAQGYSVRFHRGVTTALNALAWSARACFGDRLTVAHSDLEHLANVLPWTTIAQRVVVFSAQGPWDFAGVQVVAVTAASNVTGEGVPVREIVAAAQAVGALVVVDAAQFTAHAALPRDGWGADVIVTSGHKMYGPVGVGAWFFAPHTQLQPGIVGGGMTEQAGWEAGTWSAAEAQLLADAWEFCAQPQDGFAWTAVERLRAALGDRVVHVRASAVAPMVSYIPACHVHDTAAFFGQHGVAVRAGKLCAPQALATYRIPDSGVVRLSFGAMTTVGDVEKILSLL